MEYFPIPQMNKQTNLELEITKINDSLSNLLWYLKY